MNRNVWAAGAATVVVISVVILGFHALGGPRTQRLLQSDSRIVRKIYGLAQQIKAKSDRSKGLPSDLEGFPKSATEDPVTHQQISYRRKSDSQYELCAVFSADSRSMQAPDANDSNNFWSHPKGEYCFQFDTTQQIPILPYDVQINSFGE